ncbi:MAG: SulP family inorganic anion transporter [Acidimicrobiia bacterium]
MRVSTFAGYRRSWITGDMIAGLTVWAVLVPEALAYATIAGVTPVVGLYAAPPALVLYAVFGSSRHLVTGPMAATAALSAAAVADLTTGGPANFAAFTAVLALVTGGLALLAGLFRLGFVANFISESVLKGFIIGLALTIIVGQLPKLFGVPKGDGNFFEQCWDFLGHLGDTEWRTLVVGGTSLVLVLVLRRFVPVVPGSLVAVILGIVAVGVFDLAQHGVDVVGPIASGLPAFGLPHGLDVSDYLATTAAAIGVMFVGFAEGLGAAKTYAARDHSEIDANRELIGLGAANLGSGLCQGMIVNGSLSKTAVNVSSGARSQVSGLVVAALTLVTLLFLTDLFEDLPEATLAAVVIAALVELVDFSALARLYRLSTNRLGEIYGVAARPDFIAAVAAMLGVLIFDTLPGLFIGIAVSLLLLLYRASRPHVAELGKVPGTARQFADREPHPENRAVPGVLVVRVEGGLFFANADTVRRELRDRAVGSGAHALVLDAAAIPFVDVSAVTMLADLAQDLEASGIRLVIAHDVSQVRELFQVVGAHALLDHLYPTVQAAVDAVS